MILQNADIPNADWPHKSNLSVQTPTTLEHYDIGECRHTQYWFTSQHSHKSTLVVQSPTTQRQYDIGECRCTKCQWNPTPTLSVQSPTTPRQYDIAECRHTHCQCTPQTPLMELSDTEMYYSRTAWHYTMQMYPMMI